jgi:AcrR family transcriptional regulator
MPKLIEENIDQKILEVTLHEAATHPANRFSTRDIAKICGISEFVIFDHFKTKDLLIAKVDAYISVPFNAAIIAAAKSSVHFDEFFSKMLDYMIAHPDANAFAINYCRVFPRYERDLDYDEFKSNVTAMLETIAPYFPLAHPEDRFTLWARFNRELLCYAQLLLEKKLPDTPGNRKTMSDFLYKGLAPYKKVR